jgi:hypothetical protein
MAASPLCGQQREWKSADGQRTFKAELINAFGLRAYFQREDGYCYNLPLPLLSSPDLAYVIDWANQRDAQPRTTLAQAQGQIPANIVAMSPDRADGIYTVEEDVGAIKEPLYYAIVLIRSEDPRLFDELTIIKEGLDAANANSPNLVETLFVIRQRDNYYTPIRRLLARYGGKWLFTSEWDFAAHKDEWDRYWRDSILTFVLLDAQGHVLFDNTVKAPDGNLVNVKAYLGELADAAATYAATGTSVPNPRINREAIGRIIADAQAQKLEQPTPQPVIMNMEGLAPEALETMQGHEYTVVLTIGKTGRVEKVAMREGGGEAELEAIRRAVTLWQFLPAFKEGQPIRRAIGLPLKIKATEEPAPAPAE